MRKLLLAFWSITFLWLSGCGFLTDARNAIATASTFLKAEQEQFGPTCTSNAQQPVCQAINKGVFANNALIDAVNVYCSGVPAAGVQDWNHGGPCVPVKTAQSAVQAATVNLNQVIADLKALTGKSADGTPTTSLLEYRKRDLEAARGR